MLVGFFYWYPHGHLIISKWRMHMDKSSQNIKIGERSLADLSPQELARLDIALATFVEFLYGNSHGQTTDEGTNRVNPAKAE